MPIITIEIPTCSKDTFEERLSINLNTLKTIADKISFNILFQKEYTQDDIDRYTKLFEQYSIDFHYKLQANDYDGFLVKMRCDCHNINPISEYTLITDDDVEYHQDFCDDLTNAIGHLQNNQKQLGLVFDNFFYRPFNPTLFKQGNIIQKPKQFKVWTAGGILIKNNIDIYEHLNLNHQGVLEDNMIAELLDCKGGFSIYLCKSYRHYEFRKNVFDSGHYRHKWFRFDKHKSFIPPQTLLYKK